MLDRWASVPAMKIHRMNAPASAGGLVLQSEQRARWQLLAQSGNSGAGDQCNASSPRWRFRPRNAGEAHTEPHAVYLTAGLDLTVPSVVTIQMPAKIATRLAPHSIGVHCFSVHI